MIGIFYMLIIRPQKRQREQLKRLADSLDEGDEVMTRDGIYGTIRGVRDQDLDLEISQGVTVRLHKAAVVQKVNPEEGEEAEGVEEPQREEPTG